MHVLIVPSWYPQYEGDPSGSFFREQAIALSRRIEKVGVLFPNQRSLRELWNPKSSKFGLLNVNDVGVHLVQRNSFNWTPQWEKGFAAQFLYHGIKLYADYVELYGIPDLIHAHSALYGGKLAHDISQSTGVPYIVTEHSTGYFKKIINTQQLLLSREIFAKSSANLAVSSSLERLLVEDYCFGGTWKTVPNIISKTFFSQPIGLTEKSVPRGKFIHIAMLSPIKRQDLLIDAILICRSLGRTDLTVTIVGNGAERDRLFYRVKDLKLSNQIKFLGTVKRDQIPSLMAEHDAFVLSSDYETFGVVLGEALAVGLPCVTTDCGGSTDIMSSGDGIIVDRGDARIIAEAMIKIADRPYSKHDNQLRRNRCAERFSEDVVCTKLISIYSDVLAD